MVPAKSAPAAGARIERPSILLVGVPPEQETALRRTLNSSGLTIIAEGDAARAVEMVTHLLPRLIFVGSQLAGCDGLQFCRAVRRLPGGTNRAIVCLNASSALGDKLAAFAAGADDYITIPCYMPEVVLRVKALLTHTGVAGEPMADSGRGRHAGALRLNSQTGEVWCNGYTATLTPVETRLLESLQARCGRPVSSEELARQVWGGARNPRDLALVRVHIRNLRAKLMFCPTAPAMLKTVTGLGYCLVGGDA